MEFSYKLLKNLGALSEYAFAAKVRQKYCNSYSLFWIRWNGGGGGYNVSQSAIYSIGNKVLGTNPAALDC
jgi:hypothetical protein